MAEGVLRDCTGRMKGEQIGVKREGEFVSWISKGEEALKRVLDFDFEEPFLRVSFFRASLFCFEI